MKGISPLVASVLLIAVTMTIAGALAYWASSFVSERTKAWENQTITGECQYADFRIYMCRYNSTSQNMTLVLENLRSIELSNLKAFVIYPNGSTVSYSLNDTLPGVSVKSFKPLTNVGPDFSKVIVKTHCPTVSEETTC